jgi:rare lipoprotein A (peptidoglycan hydrolase)
LIEKRSTACAISEQSNMFTSRSRQASCLATLIVCALPAFTSIQANAKTPGKTYCFRGFCHRVLTLAETQAAVGIRALLSTSNYDDCKKDRYNPCGLTSSGAVFRPDLADNAASPVYPDGTIILVRHPGNRKTAVLRVNSAGPYHFKRLLDVSRATAEVLGFKHQGVTNLEVQILQAPTKAESTYRERRLYPPVAGFMGTYASLDDASKRYGDLTNGSNMVVAGLYPQAGGLVDLPKPSIIGNGIESKWLAQKSLTRTTKREVRQAKRIAARLYRLAHQSGRKHRLRASVS